ncbi:cell wall protein IFF6-like [Lytechinus variegatus]|uniref:cell wall protein IFF6-like n=1 Tax=Lytechinus variegatus TaxID=7654 RepID=UPI001BB1677D|nr:cell wall protein IFF6-like [Lytechinus variegatus]
MAKFVCIVALMTVAVAITQAFPMREMSEKEALLREILKMDEKFWDTLFGGDDEETTEAPTTTQPTTEATTTEAPVPIVAINKPYSDLTSAQLCGMMQGLYKRRETLETKRDVVINMMYNLCFPPSGLDAAAVLAMFSGIAPDIAPESPWVEEEEQEVEPTETVAEEEEEEGEPSRWKTLIDQLKEAQNKNTGTEEETGGETGATDTGADANDNTGTEEETGVETGATDTGADANDNTGTEEETGVETGAADTEAGANADTGADTNTDPVADTNADAGTGNVADTEAGAGADTAPTNEEGGMAETQPASAKRFADEELLELLLKAVELNREKHNI